LRTAQRFHATSANRYGHVTALDGADLDLLSGEILAVIGDNGVGKSTLVKALSGALIPDEGEIRAPDRAGAAG
jgi:fructose transport system ATP-binding protein